MMMMMMDLMFFCLMCVCAAEVSRALRSSSFLLSDGLCQYGQTHNCCWGWTRNSWGKCTPVCESGCKHGECVGPDQCRCHAGYTGKTCNQDVNECAFRPCKYRCMNTLGSYKCYCLNGYMMMTDGTCRNAHTCAMANCQYGCAMMKGKVTCQCPSPGLRLAPDRRTCVDVDECVTGQAKCPRFRKCVNTFGSYICRCHNGFELQHINGKYHCTDKKKLSVCYDKPDHKKCKCKPSVDGKGYDCKSVVKVIVEPARPVKVTFSLTTISTGTGAMKTTARNTTPTITTISTTTANPTTVITMTTAFTTTTAIPTTDVTMTTTAATTTAIPTTDVTMTTTAATTTVIPTTDVAMTTVPKSTVITSLMPTTVAMTTTDITSTAISPTLTITVTATTNPTTLSSPTETSPPTTITIATTAAPVATTTLTTAESTSTLDNRIHRENTVKPRGDVYIPRYENNLFDWDFDVELGNTAEYRRDDPGPGAVSCTFDEGLCLWMSDSGDLHWKIKEDPAGGQYLTVPEARSRRSVRGARLTVPLGPPTKAWQVSQLCLAFRHRLHGHHIGSLQVFVRKGRSHSPSIWTSTGGHGWKHTRITLWGRGLDDIVIKGERRRGKHGEIAVDDVSLRRGACSTE
ncbi:nephronectin isoform X2 [Misgurnus anguillicaudatus]|uniref:nephronectin isoform X1 n=1 Tax=Misgurnus anguillicaudatus TaxID=75329 RepID=UPI003CCFD3DE